MRFPASRGSFADFQGDIDNYQGEENDIIVASLTRSNEEGNVGFMSSPERLNVLLSRARNGLIIIGNSKTFLKSRSGKETWSKFFDLIKRLGYFYEGLPVRCEQHNDVKNVLRLPEDFERLCPDGGCTESWFVPFLTLPGFADYLNPCVYSGITMKCGIHTCPRKCHNPQAHKDLTCARASKVQLPCGHSVSRGCGQSKALPDTCFACKLAKRKAGVDNAADEDGAGPVVNPLRLLTLGHRHPRRPRRRHGETGKPVPRMITGVGVAVGPRISPRRFSRTIAALVEVQTRTRMGYSVGRSHSQIRPTLMTWTVRIPGGLLIPSGDGTYRRVGVYWLLTGSISMPPVPIDVK